MAPSHRLAQKNAKRLLALRFFNVAIAPLAITINFVDKGRMTGHFPNTFFNKADVCAEGFFRMADSSWAIFTNNPSIAFLVA